MAAGMHSNLRALHVICTTMLLARVKNSNGGTSERRHRTLDISRGRRSSISDTLALSNIVHSAHISDAELLRAWRGGNDRAGEALFERHYEAIARFFRSKVGGTDGDDLVQQVFEKCTAKRNQFRGEARFRTYLFAIAHNTLAGHFRTLRRRQKREVQISSITNAMDPFNFESAYTMGQPPIGPDFAAMQRSERRLLLEALRRSPLNYQVALELHYWERFTASEIAQIVGVPLGTVKTRIRDGRILLGRRIAEIADSPEVLKSTMDSLRAWAERIRAEVEAID